MRKRAPRFFLRDLKTEDRVTLRLGTEKHNTTETMVYNRLEVDLNGNVEYIFEFQDNNGKVREMSVYRYNKRWSYGMDAEPVRVEKVVRWLNYFADKTYVAFDRAEGAY